MHHGLHAPAEITTSRAATATAREQGVPPSGTGRRDRVERLAGGDSEPAAPASADRAEGGESTVEPVGHECYITRMSVQPVRELSGKGPGGRGATGAVAPAGQLRRVRRTEEAGRELPGLRAGGQAARRGPRPRAPLRPAGPRQDLARPHPLHRAGRGDARHQRSGAGEEGRPGRPAHRARSARHPLHRRDPPPVARGGGGALPGHGGLPLRRGPRRRAWARRPWR